MILATALQLGDYAVLGGLLSLITGVSTTLQVMAVKTLSHRVSEAERRLDEIQKRKADKYDWVRETQLTRDKLEEVGICVARLDAKMDATIGFGAVANRAVEALERMGSQTNGD